MVYLRFFVYALALVACCDYAYTAERCKRKNSNVPGQCVPLTNCPQLVRNFNVQNIASFIEDYGCGVEFETQDVLVCCPLVIAASGSVTSGPRLPDESSANKCGARQINQGAKWPFAVGLGSPHQTKDLIEIYCNGVLVTPQWVLTAAYCITDYHITAAFLGIGLAEYEKITTIPVVDRRRPSDYDHVRDQNGVALVKLGVSVQLSDDVQLACLPPFPGYDPSSPRYALYIGKIDDGSVAGGFEVTEHWRNRVPLQECRKSSSIPVFPTRAHICTDGIRACNVALNRPNLVGLNENSSYTILGVGGLYKDRCTSDVTLFTEVSKYLPWIYRIINPVEASNALRESASDLLRLLTGFQDLLVCGRRVVGNGQHWPFVVSLGSGSKSTSDYSSHCTGVLIETQWVLTDARCVQQNNIERALMDFNRGFQFATEATIETVLVPPNFNSSFVHNSVALVKLSQPVTYTSNIQPACLKLIGSHDNSSALHALSAGYSFNDRGSVFLATGLKTVGRMGDTNCLASLSVPFNAQDHSYICTTNIDACEFIANPPVLMEQELVSKSFSVVGVGGDNTNFCEGDFISYVRVRNHWNWILSQVYPGRPLSTLEVGVGKLSFIPGPTNIFSVPFSSNQASNQNNNRAPPIQSFGSSNSQFGQSSTFLSNPRIVPDRNTGLGQGANLPANLFANQGFSNNQGFSTNSATSPNSGSSPNPGFDLRLLPTSPSTSFSGGLTPNGGFSSNQQFGAGNFQSNGPAHNVNSAKIAETVAKLSLALQNFQTENQRNGQNPVTSNGK